MFEKKIFKFAMPSHILFFTVGEGGGVDLWKTQIMCNDL